MNATRAVIGTLTVVAVIVSAWAVRVETRSSPRPRMASASARDRRSAPPRVTAPIRRRPRHARDPLNASAVRHALAGRSGAVTAAVEDLRSGRTWTYRPAARDQAASVMKLDILETLLHSQQRSGVAPGSSDASTAQAMIENSDNDDAQDLWDDVGGSSGIGAYDGDAGLTQTAPNAGGYWGESTTSALDQVRLLRQLVDRRGLLDPAARAYALGLMEHVEPDQAWGVSSGVAPGATVALKNGWVPLSSGAVWEVNTVGVVRGDGRRYLLAVLSAGDPSESYGIATVDRVARLAWSGLGPRAAGRGIRLASG